MDWVQRNISGKLLCFLLSGGMAIIVKKKKKVNLRTALLENLESFTPSLWKAIDRNINVPDCDIYRFVKFNRIVVI